MDIMNIKQTIIKQRFIWNNSVECICKNVCNYLKIDEFLELVKCVRTTNELSVDDVLDKEKIVNLFIIQLISSESMEILSSLFVYELKQKDIKILELEQKSQELEEQLKSNYTINELKQKENEIFGLEQKLQKLETKNLQLETQLLENDDNMSINSNSEINESTILDGSLHPNISHIRCRCSKIIKMSYYPHHTQSKLCIESIQKLKEQEQEVISDENDILL